MIPWGSLTMGLTSLLARKCRWQLLCIMYADLLRSRVHANYHCVRIIVGGEAYLNISLLPVSNRLRGSEGDSLHKYTCIHFCPDANDAPRSNTLSRDWKLISATESDAGGFCPISAIYLAGYFIGRNNFLHNRFPLTNTTTHKERFLKMQFCQNPRCSFRPMLKVQTHKLQSLGLNMAIELSRGTSGQSPL